jgi:hypothetical protein
MYQPDGCPVLNVIPGGLLRRHRPLSGDDDGPILQ